MDTVANEVSVEVKKNLQKKKKEYKIIEQVNVTHQTYHGK